MAAKRLTERFVDQKIRNGQLTFMTEGKMTTYTKISDMNSCGVKYFNFEWEKNISSPNTLTNTF